ncbi:MAG TPA: hypothetical protein VH247_07460 [Thermoleophilaceae bacterium]|nr:hypothetical protein [Thermoleophilaceae bacterium]
MLVAALALTAPAAAPAAKPGSPQVYKVPGKIRSDCSVAVEDKLMAWLATVPDGSTVQFAQNGCYGQNAAITLTNRNRLVIDGRGSEFRALTPGESHRDNWRFVGGSDLTVQNLAVRGSDPTGAYDPANQWQHGFSVEGVQRMTFTNVQVREVFGDAIDIYRGAASPACGEDDSSARDVLVQGATLERIGRQGVAVVDGERVTVQNSAIGPVGWWGVDVETDAPCDIARHVTVTADTFGPNGRGVVSNPGFGGDPQVGDLTVTNNVQTAPSGGSAPTDCYSPISVLPPDGVYRSGYTFSGNHFLGRRYGFNLSRVRNVQISSNTVDIDSAFGCTPLVGVNLTDAHTVAINGNTFNGAASTYAADSASTDVTAGGNTPN